MKRIRPSTVARRAAVGVLLSLATSACEFGNRFAVQVPVQRPGAVSARLRIDGVSRPILERRPGPITIDTEPTGAGILEVAAAAVPESAAADASPHRCRATFASRSSAAAAPVTTELSVGPKSWTETRLDVPAAPDGATITLECDEAAPVAWAQPLLQASPAGAPLVVLVSLDTLRADHVTGFGDAGGPTPALASIANEGLSFHAAVSPYTWTAPAHYSLFYSRLFGFPPPVGPVVGLAAELRDAGYATAGFTGGGFVGSAFHFDLGFDRYAEYEPSRDGGADSDVFPTTLSDAEEWIERHRDGAAFVFLHTYAVHEVPPGERTKGGLGFNVAKVRLSDEKVETARRFYGELVGRVDAALAPFFDRLRAIARERPVLLVVLSDHGEAFREHGNFRHGSSGSDVTLHDELVRVPMIFWGPGIVGAGRISTHPFSLLDVAPTVLSTLRLPVPAPMVGRDFSALVRNEWGRILESRRQRWDEPVVSYRDKGLDAPASWSTRTSTLKRILDVTPDSRPGDIETYDLATDPQERDNIASLDVAAAVTATVDEFWTLFPRLGVDNGTKDRSLPVCPKCGWEPIQKFLATVPESAAADAASSPDVLDEETRRRLEALGYLD